MNRELYRELWTIRFKRMLELEQKSVVEYETMLKDCKAQPKQHMVVPHFERLVNDEKKHVTLVEELIKILNAQSG